MTRTDAREIAVRLLYSLAVTGQEPEALLDAFFGDGHFETLGGEDELFARCPDKKQMAYIRSLVTLCAEHRETLDDYIKKYSKGWKPERISKTAAAVLRCALCEIIYLEDVPDSAAINEAVELVNGVLGGFMRGEKGNAAVPEGAEPVPPEAEALQENE